MKQLNMFKSLLLVSLLCGTGFIKAQTLHPNHFGIVGTATSTNWYQDYVGVRFEVLSPLSVAGDKQYSYAASGTSAWGAAVTTPLVNKQIIMPQAGDSLVGSGVTVDMTGKIAFVYRGGGVYFSDKAARCFAAGAIAVVIVNNNPNGVSGMSASTPFSGCPVFMITKADGDAIDAKYHDGIAGDTARMTITLWGQNNTYDVGLINQGYSLWHDYAVPYPQLVSGIHPAAYKGQNGAFVANFGTGNPGKVTLFSTTTFTNALGASTIIHSDSTKMTTTFPAIDSIWAIYGPQFDMTGITAGDGKITTKYTVKSDSIDQYLGDDTLSYTFYLTDSLYSKGRYDFVKRHPIASFYEEPALGTTAPNGDFYLWGPMYYIAQGGGNFDTVQWSMVSNSDTGHIISSLPQVNVYLWKWTDGSGGDTLDQFVQNGELKLIGMAVKLFPSTDTNHADTSGGYFSAQFGDSLGNRAAIHVDSNSWYFVAPELPNGWFIGLDGNNNAYPRTYGRANFNNYVEYPSAMWPGGQNDGSGPMLSYPADGLSPTTFGGSNDIDSVIFSSQRGLIPAVAFTTTRFVPDTGTTDTTHTHNAGVHAVNNASQSFVVYPIPASDVVNATLNFDYPAGTVTYTVLNSLAQVVTKETHTNVLLNDTYSYPVNKLSNGNYYMVINANGKQMFKKFVVLKQ